MDKLKENDNTMHKLKKNDMTMDKLKKNDNTMHKLKKTVIQWINSIFLGITSLYTLEANQWFSKRTPYFLSPGKFSALPLVQMA